MDDERVYCARCEAEITDQPDDLPPGALCVTCHEDDRGEDYL